jgi:hypothetical protein
MPVSSPASAAHWVTLYAAVSLTVGCSSGPPNQGLTVDSEASAGWELAVIDGDGTGPADAEADEALGESETATGPDLTPSEDGDLAPPELPPSEPPDGTIPDTEPPPEADAAAEAGGPPEANTLKAAITAPGEFVSSFPEGTPVSFVALVVDSAWPAAELQVSWASDLAGLLAAGSPDGAGLHTFSTTLAPGLHVVTLTVSNPAGQVVEDSVTVAVCAYQTETFDFSSDATLTGWTTYGSAYWDPGGWLEMTGNLDGQKGALFRTAGLVDPGNVKLSFSVWTGGGINGGADGFAMSVFGVQSVADLDAIMALAGGGGCLGYGVAGLCGTTPVKAFHIELDTYYNGEALINDPTTSNHLAVTVNGDPGDHKLWVELPNLEDGNWHHVAVTVGGPQVTVTWDGETKLDEVVPGLLFHGGFIGFSGSTGWATNWHRFDDLAISQKCIVP